MSGSVVLQLAATDRLKTTRPLSGRRRQQAAASHGGFWLIIFARRGSVGVSPRCKRLLLLSLAPDWLRFDALGRAREGTRRLKEFQWNSA